MNDTDSKELHQVSKDVSRIVGILGEVVEDVKDLKKGQERLERRMDGLDRRMDGLDNRMDEMEHVMSEMNQELKLVHHAVSTDLDWDREQDERILRLEMHVGLPKFRISGQ